MNGKAAKAAAERELVAAMKRGPPRDKDEARRVLALMMAAGRVRQPTIVSTEKKKGGISSF
ncbi:hypothetical protein G6L37_04480 [Agrobacterium rubi]|nr:hypothetical protein [Agrobacterium rubi]NTF24609.1 hypothetical protein [Agrobacterium rubi]